MKSASLALLILISLIIKTPVFAASRCVDLFSATETQKSAHSKTPADQLINFFKDKTDLNYNESQAADPLIHQWILSIARDPQLKTQIPHLLLEIEKIEMLRPSVKKNPYDTVRQKLMIVKKLLKLSQAHVDEWFAYLKKPDPSLDEFNTFSTAGRLLEQLPKAEKAALLKKLGDLYAKTKNRDVVQPIHVLLNPKQMYTEFKKSGRSDRDFYSSYLELMKKYVFNSDLPVGGYSADLAIQSAQTMHEYLKTQIGMQSLNFFGSIPNGFAREKSDYDVFNHPLESAYPKLRAQAKRNKGNWSAPDPFESLRYQVDDPILSKMLKKNIADTKWKWHLENEGEHAHEHFGSQSHVFSFHITKQKVSLRFYQNYIRVDQKGRPLEAWDYIDLNVTD